MDEARKLTMQGNLARLRLEQPDAIPTKLCKSERVNGGPSLSEAKSADKANFKLLLKSLRAWRCFVASARESRVEQQFHQRQLMHSIHRSELSLMQSVLRALLINKIHRQGARRATDLIRHRQNKNLEQFYFKIIQKKFIRKQRYKEVRSVVKRYRMQRLLKSSLVGWNKVVFQVRHQQLTTFKEIMLRAKYAPELLLENVAAPYYLKAIGSKDLHNILDFHALAQSQFRRPDQSYQQFHINEKTGDRNHLQGPIRLRKHNIAIFQRVIEHILQYKQIRVIDCLKRYLILKKEFRRSQYQRRLKSIFDALVRHSKIGSQLKMAVSEAKG